MAAAALEGTDLCQLSHVSLKLFLKVLGAPKMHWHEWAWTCAEPRLQR